VLLGLAFAASLTIDAGAIAQSNLGQRRWGLVFPLVSLVALFGVLAGAWGRRDALPYALTVLFFLAAFATLGVMMWPYMIPYALTVADAAAPDASLRFFFYGGIVVLPVIAAYTVGVYWAFRGRVDHDA
jgi:cytochrome d ubiquinol oxidase subunit II